MSWNGNDLFKSVLLGTGSGSSGGGSAGGGGSSAGVSPKEVNFYDYDGTCVYAYSVAEAQALSELPAGPEHPGLVFQGWNWSLEGVKGLTRAMNIGAMYTTDDGTTRLYITLQEGRTSPMLGVGVNGTVTVDWGDGTEPDVLTGTSVSTTKWTPNHAYAAPGDYVIRLTVDGEMGLGGSNNMSNLMRYDNSSANVNQAYLSTLVRAEIGNGLTMIRQSGFQGCLNLETVTIPMQSSLSTGNSSFSDCAKIRAVNIPANVITVGSMFKGCYSLSVVCFPETATTVGVLTECYSLQNITYPNGVNELKTYAVQSCYGVKAVSMPDDANIGNQAFINAHSLMNVIIPSGTTNINQQAFYNCKSLVSVKANGDVTSISAYAFASCFSLAMCDFTACTSVPTLANITAFSTTPDDCVFLIPSALYDEWIAATNWTTYADRCVAS